MEGKDWTIRLATREDLRHLGALEAAGDAQFPVGRFPGEPGSDNVPVDELDRGLADGLLWVAADESGSSPVIAFLLARKEARHLHLRQVVVHPDRQNRGVGKALLAELESEGRRRGMTELTLTTFGDIPWNAPLYGHLGYRIRDGAELSQPDMEYLARELAEQSAAGMTCRVAMSKSPGNRTGVLEK